MAKGHKDKVAVITGGANGIGQAFAKRLAEDGVHIAIVDLAPAAETVKMVEATGRQALAISCDVSSPDAVGRGGAGVAGAADVGGRGGFGRCPTRTVAGGAAEGGRVPLICGSIEAVSTGVSGGVTATIVGAEGEVGSEADAAVVLPGPNVSATTGLFRATVPSE